MKCPKNSKLLFSIWLFRTSSLNKNTISFSSSTTNSSSTRKTVIYSTSFRQISSILNSHWISSRKALVGSSRSFAIWKILRTIYLLRITSREIICFAMMMWLKIGNMHFLTIWRIIPVLSLFCMIVLQLRLSRASRSPRIFWSSFRFPIFRIMKLLIARRMGGRLWLDGWISRGKEREDRWEKYKTSSSLFLRNF